MITGDEGGVNIDIISSPNENGNVVDGMGGVVGIANGGTGGGGVEERYGIDSWWICSAVVGGSVIGESDLPRDSRVAIKANC